MSKLKTGQMLRTKNGERLEVVSMIAEGGQGQVYKVKSGGRVYALKWYHEPTTPLQQQQAVEQLEAINGYLLKNAPPDPRFLWPLDAVMDPQKKTFGYLMELLPDRFIGLDKLVLGRMRPVPSFRTLCRAAINLSECFRKLHNMGACYKDINLGGPFIDPQNGDVMICDTDNVRVNKTPGNIIFIFFAAPELIRNEGVCQTDTDIHSLAVLLFYMFIRHHPLDGKRELEINVFNEIAQRKFYGRDPVFIYDPDNASNRPMTGFHDQAIRNWRIYPGFLKRLFTRSFTDGLHEPRKRVREGEWMAAFSKLRDGLFYCNHCGIENFFDFEHGARGEGHQCWRCQKDCTLPMRLDIGDRKIFLNYNTELYPHHLGERLDFSAAQAQINQHPNDPNKWGLKNMSCNDWSFSTRDGKTRIVSPGKSVPLLNGMTIQFGKVEGVILNR